MKKFKFSQAVHLGTVLTAEEMKQIQGTESDTANNCKCVLRIAGLSGDQNGGLSNQKNGADCQYHCEAVCRTYSKCYFARGEFGSYGSGSF